MNGDTNTHCRFIKGFVTVLIIVVMIAPPPLKADNNSCEAPSARTIIDALMNYQFKQAREILMEWQRNTPESYEALFYSATIDMAEAKTRRKTAFKRFNTMAMKKLKRVEKQLSSQQTRSPDETLTLGMAEAFIARLELENEQWMRAYKAGKRARNRLRQLQKTAPQLHDAKLVLGLYEFYTGDIPLTLKWLTYLIDLSGNRKKGIALLENSVEFAGVASPEAARTLLDELELDAPEICRWLPLNEHMKKRYPNNPRFAWLLQRHYRECGHPNKALKENHRATHQFASYSGTRKHLLSDRAKIYRDLGDIAGLEHLKNIKPKIKNLDLLVREANYVNGDRSGKKYSPPTKINNVRALIPHNYCRPL